MNAALRTAVFVWNIDGYTYMMPSKTYKKHFRILDDIDMHLELRPIKINDVYYMKQPLVSMRGYNTSFTVFNLCIFDDNGIPIASILNAKPIEEFQLLDVKSSSNGYSYFTNFAGPYSITMDLILPLKIKVTLDFDAFLIALEDALPLPSLPKKVKGNKIMNDFTAMALSDQLSDFTFTVGGEDFPVHKAILGARSAVFMKMFTGEFKESSALSGIIKDVSKEAFQKFLCFIYSGNVELTADDVVEILDLSNKYEVEDLKGECESYLMGDLNVDNAHDVFQYAHLYNCPIELKKAAFGLVQRSFAAVNRKLPETYLSDPKAVKKSIKALNDLDETL